MTFPARFAIYTFATITFIRRVEEDFPPWFFAEPSITKDVVLGGATAYLDLGAYVFAPLTFRASCLSATDRVALIAALMTTDVLSNTRGQSANATLIKALPVDSGDYSRYFIDLSFEYRP